MNSNFKKRKVFTMTLGEELKALRQSRGISIRDVVARTRIQRNYLEALESGHYQDLPAGVYTRGFIKSYADFLGLESRDYLRRYTKEKEIQTNILSQRNIPPKNKSSMPPRSFIITPKRTITGLIILLVLFTVFYIYYQVNSFVSPPKLTLETPAENMKIRSNSITVRGKTDSEATLSINGQKIFVNDDGYFNERVTLKEGINVLNISATGFSGKTEMLTREIVVEPKGEVVGEEIKKENGLVLKVAIKDEPTWISIDSDGKNVYSGIMVPDSSESFRANEKINVTSGRANKTEIFLNDRPWGILDNSPGVVRNIEFTKNTEPKK